MEIKIATISIIKLISPQVHLEFIAQNTIYISVERKE